MKKLNLFLALAACALMLNACAKKNLTPPVETTASTTAVQPAASTDDTAPVSLRSEGISETGVAEKRAPKLEKIFFEYDAFTLTAEARDILNRNAEWLRQNPAVTLTIEGHCDERGSDEYNLALGARRAETVRSYLITLGIAAERLNTISYGEERPAVSRNDESAWAENRRAEFL